MLNNTVQKEIIRREGMGAISTNLSPKRALSLATCNGKIATFPGAATRRSSLPLGGVPCRLRGVPRSLFFVLCSETLAAARRSSFFVLRSSFFVLRSSFFVLRSSFFVLRSSLPLGGVPCRLRGVPRSLFFVLCSETLAAARRSSFFVLCSLFFVLCSLFFVLCSETLKNRLPKHWPLARRSPFSEIPKHRLLSRAERDRLERSDQPARGQLGSWIKHRNTDLRSNRPGIDSTTLTAIIVVCAIPFRWIKPEGSSSRRTFAIGIGADETTRFELDVVLDRIELTPKESLKPEPKFFKEGRMWVVSTEGEPFDAVDSIHAVREERR